MSVYFSIVTNCQDLLIDNDVIRWHLDHGAVYNVHRVNSGCFGSGVGVVYLTVLCGLGAIVHFDTAPDITPADLRAAAKKVTGFIADAYPALFATIPGDRTRLLRFVRRLGFRDLPGGSIPAAPADFMLLKYFKRR